MGHTNGIQWILAKEELSREDVVRVEKQLNISFPRDYVECVLHNNGGQPIPDIFDFEGHKGSVMNALIHLNSEEDMHVIDVYEKIKDRLPQSIYPFADDPFGNYLCFDYRYGNSPVIVYWDHEKSQQDKNTAISFVCGSFSEMLGKLHD
ncbi:SMI1/KNR4 family protein [Paenibacillus sp. Soil724D2]|uniref:SMI1/KNR4 family protein n=1 Tax=Paenibacillus sp. (strain Soil724D2) TaxID=1736392 RepID=UPI00138F9C8B|nr:SMI1/KNR4 family protein [Paenibacillus sp. Soil724D2]